MGVEVAAHVPFENERRNGVALGGRDCLVTRA
jgi:hypothetical protein